MTTAEDGCSRRLSIQRVKKLVERSIWALSIRASNFLL